MKNCIINMYGDDIWYFSFYDMDSSLGLNNTGYSIYDCNIEPSQPGVYNCSTSRMWVKLNDWAQEDLFNQFKIIREGKYTYENICSYLIGKQIDVIPQILYNKDMYSKYISQGRQYLHMLHGNNKDHLKRWLYNRFQYVDSLFLQQNSPYTKQSITIRSCAPVDAVPKLDEEGNVISPYTARFEIQTYSPQYVTVCWRKNTYETKRVDWGETVVFECDMVNTQDNEIILYGASCLKSIGDISCLNPTSIDIGAATRLIEFKCENSDKLVKADISKNSYLKSISFKGCSVMGTASGGSNVLDVSKSTNLKEVDIRGTKITSVLSNTEGGNLEKILYPTGIQTIVLANQTNLEVIGIPYEDIALCKNLVTVNIKNCNSIKSLKYPYEENEPITLDSIQYVQNLTIDNSIAELNEISFAGFNSLRNLTLQNMPKLKNVDFTNLLLKSANRALQKVSFANIPNIKSLSFNITNDDYKIGFADNAVVDVGGISSITKITSNTPIQGLNTLIVPTSVQELIFTNEIGSGINDIENIWSYSANHSNDGFTGMDLQDIELSNLNMIGLTNVKNAINFKLSPIDQHPNMNTNRNGNSVPYFRPEGILDLSNYTKSMVGMLKGIDLNKLNVIVDRKQIQTDLTSLFEGAIIPEEKTALVNSILDQYSNSTIWDKMFKNADVEFDTPDINIPEEGSGRNMSLIEAFRGTSITTDIYIGNNILNVSDMFRDCVNMTEYLENWAKEYQNGIISDRCYFGTGGDLDFVPANWGGYGFFPNVVSEIEVNIPTNNYKLTLVEKENVLSRGVVKWGDKSVGFLGEDDNYSHVYIKAGTYVIKGHFTFGNDIAPTASIRNCMAKVTHLAGDTTNLNQAFKNCISLKSFSPGIVLNVESMQDMFSGCSSLTSVDLSLLNTANCTTMRNTFNDCSSLQSIDLSSLGSNALVDMYGTFYNCEKLKSIDLTNFNSSNVENMYGLFYGCKSLESIDLSDFNTSNVQNMAYMFFNCTKITTLDLSSFNTSNATKMEYMFARCTSLLELDLSNFTTENVTSMFDMFYNCTSLTSLNISNFNTSKVTDMQSMFNRCNELLELNLSNFTGDVVTTTQYMFSGCNKLTTLVLTNFNTPVNTNMRYMFSGCSELTELDLSALITDKVTSMYSTFINCTKLTTLDISSFDTSNVENMQNMFSGCSSLQSLDLTGFNTSKVLTMQNMFINCNGLTTLDLSSFDTSKVISMYGMFYSCSSLLSIDVSSFNTDNVANMYGMFYGCSSLLQINVSNFNTSNVENMQYMFNGCSSLQSLDLSSFDTSKVTSMNSMIYGCFALTNLNVSSFDTSSVTDMNYMLSSLYALENLNISHFNTSNVTKMNNLFSSCSNLLSLDLSNWDTSKVTDMGHLFSGCNKLNNLLLTDWNTTKVTNMQYMFENCRSLTSLDLSSFNTISVTTMESMFENCKFNVDFNGKSTVNLTNTSRMFRGFLGTSINMQGCNFINAISNDDFIQNANNLVDFTAPNNIGSNITILANNLSLNSLLSILNNLSEVTTTQTLDIGSTNIGKLTDEQILIATNKNWTLC